MSKVPDLFAQAAPKPKAGKNPFRSGKPVSRAQKAMLEKAKIKKVNAVRERMQKEGIWF